VHDDPGGIQPYLSVVLVAVVIGVALAIYLAGYRDEIMAILNQSPT
jgi:ABC-type phosphate transport system permease subunit